MIYKQKQDLSAIPQEIIDRFYPVLDESGFRDYHIAYYGEIVNAYLIETWSENPAADFRLRHSVFIPGTFVIINSCYRKNGRAMSKAQNCRFL